MFGICYSWNMPKSVNCDFRSAGLTLSYPETKR